MTTIFGPDVSNYQRGLRLQPGTAFVFWKATEGTGWTDPSFADFKAQAASVGAVGAAYHFLHLGNAAAQAEHALSVVGKSLPLMLDWERYTSGGATYRPLVADALAFADRYRQLGGIIRPLYLPPWYWREIGSPSLKPFIDRGLWFVSSGYTAYSDNGPGWASYGGQVPKIWQFTDSFSYGGMRVDFNAYRGTVDQLKADLGLTSPSNTPVVTPVVTPAPEEDEDMPQQIEPLSVKPSGAQSYAFPKGKYKEVAFLYDNSGGPLAKIRVAVWDAKGVVVSTVDVGSPDARNHSKVVFFGDPASAYGIDVTRLDNGPRPVGVAFA